jgi:hypothetical protein
MKSRSRLILGSGSSDIDLRSEFSSVVKGSLSEVGRGRPAILRRMNRDVNHNLIMCHQCRTPANKGINSWQVCDVCLGSGFLWQEEWITCYVTSMTGNVRRQSRFLLPHQAGDLPLGARVIYVEAHVNPKMEDQVVLVTLDIEGRPVIPYVRSNIFKTRLIFEHRLDGGKVEFWGIIGEEIHGTYFGEPLDMRTPGAGRIP